MRLQHCSLLHSVAPWHWMKPFNSIPLRCVLRYGHVSRRYRNDPERVKRCHMLRAFGCLKLVMNMSKIVQSSLSAPMARQKAARISGQCHQRWELSNSAESLSTLHYCVMHQKLRHVIMYHSIHAVYATWRYHTISLSYVHDWFMGWTCMKVKMNRESKHVAKPALQNCTSVHDRCLQLFASIVC